MANPIDEADDEPPVAGGTVSAVTLPVVVESVVPDEGEEAVLSSEPDEAVVESVLVAAELEEESVVLGVELDEESVNTSDVSAVPLSQKSTAA